MRARTRRRHRDGPRATLRSRRRGRSRVGHAGAPREERAHRLAGAAVGLLGQVADGRGRRRPRHGAAVGTSKPARMPQQRALAGPVRRDDADAAAGPNRERHRVEHDARPERLRDFTGDKGGGRRLRHGRTSGAARRAARGTAGGEASLHQHAGYRAHPGGTTERRISTRVPRSRALEIFRSSVTSVISRSPRLRSGFMTSGRHAP